MPAAPRAGPGTQALEPSPLPIVKPTSEGVRLPSRGCVCGWWRSLTAGRRLLPSLTRWFWTLSLSSNLASSAVNTDRHFSCEDCHGHIVLCQNNIRSEAHMSRVVTHELIHAFDHCRAHVHWFSNVRHLACSEVRAANLSGDCSLVNELFRLRFGLKQHHQTCVRDRAILSILAVRNISKEVAQKAVAEVFESCFNDLEPFGRIPHNKTYARYAHRDFQNRDRYYSNI
uniref:Mitochondrial inner membrane protease ATP23 n=1 Tax=Oryctolagus cuniculus TaxID=9986 RepID=G1SGH1_RABIT